MSRDNAGRPNPAGEDALARRSVHRRTPPVPAGLTGTGTVYAVSCPCGWWETDLPSKRAGHRAITRHLEDEGSLLHELETPAGRGRLAARAYERAVDVLTARHAGEVAQLAEAERVKLGLAPAYQEDRPA